jgi:hypothetical protein
MVRLMMIAMAVWSMHQHDINPAARDSVFAPLWQVQQNSTLRHQAVTYGWSGASETQQMAQKPVKYGW